MAEAPWKRCELHTAGVPHGWRLRRACVHASMHAYVRVPHAAVPTCRRQPLLSKLLDDRVRHQLWDAAEDGLEIVLRGAQGHAAMVKRGPSKREEAHMQAREAHIVPRAGSSECGGCGRPT
eukprot:326722-Chlamydomonas_euryale.AAC.1